MRVAEKREAPRMPPKPGYKQPGREGQAPIIVHVAKEIREDFKIATIENGTTMQAALAAFVETYAAKVTARRKKSRG